MMITEKQISFIREHLNKTQNPVFLFDNDQDGLCSFLLLQRYCQKGKGIPIKGSPNIMKDYLKKINEFNSDYVFILDKPNIPQSFFDEIRKINLPIVWIDHHLIDTSGIPNFVEYYNPLINEKRKPKKTSVIEGEPVTYICYKITNKREDLWIAIIGCISDRYFPNFYKEFKEKYPDLAGESEDSTTIFYKEPIGKIAQIIGNGLKDRTSNVVSMMRFLLKAKNPYEILEEKRENKSFHKRFNEINYKKNKLLNKAIQIEKNSSKILFFKYRGNLSISRELADELIYLFPDKIIIVAYIKNDEKANISIRGKNVRKIFYNLFDKFENLKGGGHEQALGAQVRIEELERFVKEFEIEYKNLKNN